MIKIIASDMDGTLLNNQHNISKVSERAIKFAQEKGVHFIISTGRDYESVSKFLSERGIKCECILMNGAEYRDEHGNIIEKINIDKSKVSEIIKRIQAVGLSAEIFTSEGTYTTDSEEDSLIGFAYRIQVYDKIKSFDEALIKAKELRKHSNLKYIDDINKFLESSIEVRKIIAFHSDVDKVWQAKNSVSKIEGLAVSSSFVDNIEVTNELAQKGIMLGKVADKMGINRDDVIIFGDSFNDYSMFTEFKNSYAMANAITEIKDIAKNITDTNDNDGVAKAIYNVLG